MPRPDGHASAGPGRRAIRLASVLLLVPLVAGAAEKDGAANRLKEVERQLEETRGREANLEERESALDHEVLALRAAAISAAKAVHSRDSALSRLETRLAAMATEAAEKSARLDQRRDQLAGTLAALTRLARVPPSAALALPMAPADTVRGALLLRAAVPALETRARNLRDELDVYADLRDRIAGDRVELARQGNSLAGERRRLDGLLHRKRNLSDRARAETERARNESRRLAEKAADLRDLLAKLETARKARERAAALARPKDEALSAGSAVPPPPGGARNFSQARGRLPFPAPGRILRRYGERTEGGTASAGIVIATRPGAPVIAPHDGLVVFAGTFRGYGQLLIIEHGEGYHTLLSGLFRIDASAGQWLLVGEPVGVMGEAESGKTSLYVELRRKSQPINPLPWLTAQRGKVSG
ncbi:MAG: murein hydrolase activator EnvC family protein [Alphaproteobacteria bacterium]